MYFEKENINTLDDSTEMILTILSSQAQEESRAISTNVKWGYARKLKRGNPQDREAMDQESANRRDVHRGGGSRCYPKHGPVVSGRGQPGTN